MHGGSSAAAAIALFALHVTAARFLGAVDYGYYSFGLAFAAMFIPVFNLGMQSLTIREVARNRGATSDYIAHALIYKAIIAPIVFLVAIALLYFLQDSARGVFAGSIMFLAMWIFSLHGALTPVLVAHERFDLNAMNTIIEKFGLLASVSLVCVLGYGLFGVATAHFIWRVVGFVFLTWLVASKVVRFRLALNRQFLRRMVLAAIPIGGVHITSYVYNYLDTIMIGAMRSPEEVGWYSAAYRLFEGPMIFPVVVGTVLMPRISRAYAERNADLFRTIAIGFALVLGLGVACTLIWLVIAAPAIRVFYGEAFANSTPALRILTLGGTTIAFVNHFFQTTLISINKQRAVLISAICGLVFNAALNLYLISRFGYVGAAWATVVSAFFVLVVIAIVGAQAWREVRDVHSRV